MHSMKRIAIAAAALCLLPSMAACGGSSSTGAAGDADNAELIFWGWDPSNNMNEIIANFQNDNPGITVKFNNTGTAEKTSTALSNAIAAGNGAPDVVMLEGPTVTQYAVTEGIVDLNAFGAHEIEDEFVAGSWGKMQYADGTYGLPITAGPEVFFYNDAVFSAAGVDAEAIETWDDYYEAAKKIRATGAYITNMAGTSNDYSPFTAQVWQAGAQPWTVEGDEITIDMADEGMQKYVDHVQRLIDEDLVDTKTSNWSDDWNRSLNDGSIASLTIGAWMPVNLMNGAPDQAGNWRVRDLPQWEAGVQTSSEDGGSALAVVSQSVNQAAAYKFVEYLAKGDGATFMAQTGNFPAVKSLLDSEEFLDENHESNQEVNAYFGGQNVNAILANAAKQAVSTFQFLPFNAFAQSSHGDEISKAYAGDITLAEAMANYGQTLATHAEQQGYKVTLK